MKNTRPASTTEFFIYTILFMALMTYSVRAYGASLAGDQGRFFYTRASWYSNVETNNRRCADGRWHDLSKEFVAASWTYDIGTRLRVKRVGGKELVYIVIVDRGPAKRLCKVGRCLDLSKASFEVLAPLSSGVIEVVVEII